jgi:hypothetical protein
LAAPRSGVASPEPEAGAECFLSGVPGPPPAPAPAADDEDEAEAEAKEEAGAEAVGEGAEDFSLGESCSVWVLAAILTRLAHDVGFAAPPAEAEAAEAAAEADAAAVVGAGEAAVIG